MTYVIKVYVQILHLHHGMAWIGHRGSNTSTLDNTIATILLHFYFTPSSNYYYSYLRHSCVRCATVCAAVCVYYNSTQLHHVMLLFANDVTPPEIMHRNSYNLF